MFRKCLFLAMFACCCSIASAKEEDSAPGLKLGAKAPDFKLDDQGKKHHKLSDYLKKGPVAVVFYRSTVW